MKKLINENFQYQTKTDVDGKLAAKHWPSALFKLYADDAFDFGFTSMETKEN